MQRILDATAAATLPTVPSLVGSSGYFTEGVIGVTAPTNVRAWWLTMIQEELISILTAAGVTPDTTGTVYNQVLSSIEALITANEGIVTQVTDTGTANAMVITLSPAPASLAAMAGRLFAITKSASGNTGVTTINPNGLGNTAFNRADTSALPTGWYPAASDGLVLCTGTSFVLLNCPAASFIVPHGSAYFTSSGNWTCPAGVTSVLATIMAGGGGSGAGGPSAGNTGGSGGGGAGCYVRQPVTVVPGTVYPVTVGAGGAAGVVSSTAPTSGSSSTFGGFTATGGSAGANSSASGGAGGSPGGGPGSPGSGTGGSGQTFGGNGGGSPLSSGTPGGFNTAGQQNATAFGAGAAGGSSNINGGNGTSGYVLLEY